MELEIKENKEKWADNNETNTYFYYTQKFPIDILKYITKPKIFGKKNISTYRVGS